MAETDWAAQQEAVRLAIAAALKLPDKATIGGRRVHKRVEWSGRDSADRWAQGGAIVELRLGAVVPRGQLEPRYVTDGATLQASYGRYETFSVTVAIENDNQDPAQAAVGTLTGRLRTRLQRPEILAILQDEGVAFVEMGSTTEADYQDDGREISAARVDIRFGHAAFDADDEEEGTDFFNKVLGDGDDELDGVDLDVGPP